MRAFKINQNLTINGRQVKGRKGKLGGMNKVREGERLWKLNQSLELNK